MGGWTPLLQSDQPKQHSMRWTNFFDRLFQLVVVVCLVLMTGIISTSAWYTHHAIKSTEHALTKTLPEFVSCTEASLREQVPDLVMPKSYTDVTKNKVPVCRVLAEQILAPTLGRNDSDTGSLRSIVKSVSDDHGKVKRTLAHVESTSAQVHRLTNHLIGAKSASNGTVWPLVAELPDLIALVSDLQQMAARVRSASEVMLDNLEQVAMPKVLNLSNALPAPDRLQSAFSTVETTLNAANHLSALLDSKLGLLFSPQPN